MDDFGRNVVIISGMLLVMSAILMLSEQVIASLVLVISGFISMIVGRLHSRHMKQGREDNAEMVLNFFYLIGGTILLTLSLWYYFNDVQGPVLEIVYFLTGIGLMKYSVYKIMHS